ncbi:acyl-CoA dehydrogenase family protein [Ideonella sp. DXS22W]|uniref:Acyl-CoA dehydrogenase family protein n=1 Tax=Pseudaquabacterium inlustre TaxID=2984192 RepID=A0ABU9CJA1_9BURK
MHAALRHALSADPQARPQPTVTDWWPHRPWAGAVGTDPLAMALLGGFAADRVAWAFASGYQAALRALCPDLPGDALAAFCVTEDTGNRPRDIRSTLTAQAGGGWQLDGAKRWTTLGPSGTLLLVAAALPPQAGDERPQLRLLRVPVPTPGLAITPMPATRFVPEVPHATLRMDSVHLPAEALLPGDGYARYVKPFRTLEDLHVTLAVLAYLLREARARAWPEAFREQLAAVMALLATLAGEDVQAPATHVALAGALHLAHASYVQAQPLWAAAGEGDEAAQRWQRDAALFAVAGAARQQRAATAWQRLAAG